MKHLVAPSILAADFANLQRDVEMINESEADWIHVDIMDGVFVPNISFGFPVAEAIAKHAKKPLDVHLMIVDPDRYITRFRDAGAAVISVHYEACTHLHRTVHAIREAGCMAGVALNPHTPVHVLEDILEDIDQVLLMSVNPGFGGQQFIGHTFEKTRKLAAMAAGHAVHIEIDGGVSSSNAGALLAAGANVLVAGNFVFSAPDPRQVIAGLKNLSPEVMQA
ncbi:ribulose-phosphate 3-epimerase [Hufsiella ginkgonis]|uniref:Ribulose-phosphate 3-epimerase n=1 Tax=Hufsiella ginkgonis TaxID=2695274 RepID=A0A7K1XXD1_9SPHI|nr:ribulose-phosphate 3-epimerase [Hufsiella ginkgonis]MXV15497.1 ribulose-phosphate 3-epimerase [Hufsiella ginkgonis]